METLLSGIGSLNLRWQDLLDILITAFVIYRVLLLIRGTLAIKMVSALAVLVLVFRVSEWLQFSLSQTSWRPNRLVTRSSR